ncbi:prostate stem cell antigen-like [Hypanus sabinus]|uniref:prostate stem cell antigen-like n=1 Tax=Hypanus sabinus TaxID=79690 RepID=UPI0028C40B27|nr:prostate stem cell antigen-like [Hypanus sabinus]
MKYLLLLGCGLLLCASLGTCLECFRCAISLNKCISDKVNCTQANEKCFLQVGKAGIASVYRAGCSTPEVCGQNSEQSFLGQTVSLKTSCCDTDLCNGSDYIKLSLPLCLIVVALWFL